MQKIAIFVEGQSELIFVRDALTKIYDWIVSFECHKLHSGNLSDSPYNITNEHADKHFLIVNCQSDDNVLSAIKEREQSLLKQDYSKIIGLRDIYNPSYRKIYDGKVSIEGNKKIMSDCNSFIQKFNYPDKIKFFFSIMEFEAWFLAMPNIFTKFSKTITLEKITSILGKNPESGSVENEILHPSVKVAEILSLCGIKYDKKNDDICSFMAKIDLLDIKEGTKRSVSLKKFYAELTT